MSNLADNISNEAPVFHFIKDFSFNHGPSRVINNIIQDNKNENNYIISFSPFNEKLVNENLKVFSPKAKGWVYQVIFIFKVYIELKKKANLVLVGHLIHGALGVVLFKFIFPKKSKIVMVVHNVEDYFIKNGLKFFIARIIHSFTNFMSKLNISVSQDVKSVQEKNGLIKRQPKNIVIHNGVCQKDFYICNKSRKKIRKFYNFSEEDFVLLLTGAFIERKNFSFVLDLAENLNTLCDSNLKILLAGKGEDYDNLKKINNLKEVKKNIYFVGFQRNIMQFYNACDLFCLPSKREGFGLVLIEAMMCGKPCLGADVFGISEVLEKTYGGYKYSSQDKDRFLEKFSSIINSLNRKEIDPQKIRSNVIEKYSSEKMKRIYEDNFNKLRVIKS